MRRLVSVAVVVGVALLVLTAQPAAAVNVTVSEHTTFGTGSQGEPSPTRLTNATVSGSGTSASVADQFEPRYEDNPFFDEGDGNADTTNLRLFGDTAADKAQKTEVRIDVETTQRLEKLVLNYSNKFNADYGYMVDVYIVQEKPDGNYAEGTKVASFDPDYTTSQQTVQFSSPFKVTSGKSYSIEFITQSVDFDGQSDQVIVRGDDSATTQWYSSRGSSASDFYPDVKAVGVETTSAKYVGAAHAASDVTSGEVELSLTDASATVKWQEDANNDNNWNTVSTATYSTSGTKSQSLSGTTSDRWRAVVEFSTSSPSTATAQLDAERVISNNEKPTVSNPDPTGSLQTYDGDISALVEDPDFPTAQGESVTVVAENTDTNTQIGSTTVTANQTVALDYVANTGTNNITWTVTDSASQTDTVDQQFTAPEQLRIFNVSRPSTLVSGSSNKVTIQFINGTEVIQKSTTTGQLSLGTIPAAPPGGYVVVLQPEGDYEPRTIVIRSLIRQHSAYLLPTNATRSEIEFVVDDRTGEFSEPTLIIERPLTKDFDGDGDTETKYQRVGGEKVGASDTVVTTLENQVRYQLRIRNVQGDTRVLGSFTPTRAQSVTLTVGELEFAVREGQDRTFNATATLVKQNGNVTAVRFAYRDPSNETSKVNVTVRTLDGRVLGTSRGLNGPYGQFSFTQPVSDPENDSYVVEFNATVDGKVASGQLRPGATQLPPGVPLKPGLKHLFAVGLVLMVGGLFSASNARVGAVVTPLFAGGLWVVNWLPGGVTIFAIAVALGVGVLVNAVRRQP